MLPRPNLILTALAILLAIAIGSKVQAQTEQIRKTDNFCFFVDHSASMQKNYMDMGSKIRVVKNLLADLNMEIPPLGYKAALYSFAPVAQYQIFLRYDRMDMLSSISRLETDYSPILNTRTTPIGDGLEDFAPKLDPLTGKISLLLFSDGEQNTGRDPIRVARELAEKYGDRLCIHVVSLAQTFEEQQLLEALSNTTPCGILASADELQSEPILAQFVEDVFYYTQTRVSPQEPVKIIPSPAVVVEEPDAIVLRGVGFDFDKSDIKPEFVPVLDEAVNLLNARSFTQIRIEGHTCSIGTDDYNQELSERRAAAVKRYLLEQGVDASRLETVGYGESRPRFDNSTREGRSKNRRVELVVE